MTGLPFSPLHAGFGAQPARVATPAQETFMTEQTVHAPQHPSQTHALDILKGTIDHDAIREFKRRVFSTVIEFENLKDWLATPAAQGLQRGLVLWALGRHNEAVPLLEKEKGNRAIADCL